MKNKSFITLLSVSLLAFSSCSDFLDHSGARRNLYPGWRKADAFRL